MTMNCIDSLICEADRKGLMYNNAQNKTWVCDEDLEDRPVTFFILVL